MDPLSPSGGVCYTFPKEYANGREGEEMLLRQMRYFMEVVDRGSFTQAAEACFISQSAISQQIKALEEELGAQLLLNANRNHSQECQL